MISTTCVYNYVLLQQNFYMLEVFPGFQPWAAMEASKKWADRVTDLSIGVGD